jgi:hypothetical protein
VPAVSKSQRRFFGWAEHNPEAARAEGKATGMNHQQMHDFADTPESGLPERKKTMLGGAVRRANVKIHGR